MVRAAATGSWVGRAMRARRATKECGGAGEARRGHGEARPRGAVVRAAALDSGREG